MRVALAQLDPAAENIAGNAARTGVAIDRDANALARSPGIHYNAAEIEPMHRACGLALATGDKRELSAGDGTPNGEVAGGPAPAMPKPGQTDQDKLPP